MSGSLVRSRTVTLEVPELHFLFYYFKAYLAVTLFSAFSYHIIKLRQTLAPLLPPSPHRPPALLAPPATKSTFQERLNTFVEMRAKVKQKHLSLVGRGGGVPQM